MNSSTTVTGNSSARNEQSSSSTVAATTALSRPGAYSVSRSGQGSQVFRVQIPMGVQPGQVFEVLCGQGNSRRSVRVRCPANSRGM